MSTWQAHEANQHFDALIDLAIGQGPQIVVRHDDPVAVVLSTAEFRRLTDQADLNFADLLAPIAVRPRRYRACGNEPGRR